MRKPRFLVLSALLIICLGFGLASAQDSANPDRKIVKQTMPRYPEVARRMKLTGTVKVIAVVSPDGKVKSVETVGGSPVLIQAAKDAILEWKFVPASAESRQVVELHFNPTE